MSENITEQELLNLGLGIVPATDEHTPIAPIGVINMVDGSGMEYMHDHVFHWFNEYLYNRVINLNDSDKDRYFQMITDYGDLLAKIVNDDNNVMFKYSQKGEAAWLDLEEHAKRSGTVVDYERPKQLIKEYDAWKAKQGL